MMKSEPVEAKEYFKKLSDLLNRAEVSNGEGEAMPFSDAVRRTSERISAFRNTGKKVLLIGNGGSAAIVSHMHNDLSKAVGVRAMVFHETSLLTALSNDISYEEAYEWSIRQWAEPDDLLIAVSSSGASQNILRAAKAARARQCGVVTFSGFKKENPLRRLGDINFYVPNPEYGFVEVSHMAIGHCITDLALSLA